MRDRFNEDVTSEYQRGQAARQSGGLHHRTLKQLKQSRGNGAGGPASQASSRAADVFTNNKRRSMAPSQVAASVQGAAYRTAAAGDAAADAQSVITQDRLKRFNDIQGTVAGNVTDEIAAKEREVEFAEGELEPGQGEEGCGQGVALNTEGDEQEEQRDEVVSM